MVLLDVPLLMHWAWQEHAASLLREYLLLVLDEEPAALEAHAAASDALDILREAIPPPLSVDGGTDAVLARAEDPDNVADRVVLEVPESSVASFVALERTLEAATVAAREGRLLGPPTQPEIEQLRSWLCQEVSRQAEGSVVPVPWRASTEVGRARRRVDDVACAELLAGRGAALVADQESVVVAVSEEALHLLGYADEAALLGRPVLAVVPPRFHQAHVAGTTLHVTNGRDVLIDVPLEVPVVRADGSEQLVGLHLSAHRRGEEPYVLAVLTPAGGPPG